MSSSKSISDGEAGGIREEREPLPGFTSHSHNFGSNRSRRALSFSAFEAALQHRDFLLTKIADPVSKTKPIADDLVPVPWWILDAIADGWKRYQNAPSNQTLGECFDLEGGGQGKRPAKEMYEKALRDRSLARDVMRLRQIAKSEGRKLSLANAFSKVAENTGFSVEIVRRAYKSIPRIK